jgi:hypothetical protein
MIHPMDTRIHTVRRDIAETGHIRFSYFNRRGDFLACACFNLC